MDANGSQNEGRGRAWEMAQSCRTLIEEVVASHFGGREDREDVVSEAVAHLEQHLEGHDPGADLQSWARQIAQDFCHTRVAQAAHEPQTISLSDVGGEVSDPAGLPSPYDILQHEELDEALDSLPRPDRAVLKLHCLDRMSLRRTAAALGMTVRCVKGRVERAKEKLRRKLRRRMG